MRPFGFIPFLIWAKTQNQIMTKIKLSTVLVCISIMSSAQSITDLDFLIGNWWVNETLFPGTDRSYTENGSRVCEYYLDSSFIRCESSTISSRTGKKRFYTYFINYDKNEDCFWVTALSNDFPKHDKQQWFLDSENEQIIVVIPKSVFNNQFFRATISFRDRNQLVWDGWYSKFRGERDWTHIMNDVAIRQ